MSGCEIDPKTFPQKLTECGCGGRAIAWERTNWNHTFAEVFCSNHCGIGISAIAVNSDADRRKLGRAWNTALGANKELRFD